ncbi:MAG: class I SAM-dependent methyltransferase [Magnetococcus sp. DMHC-8]
MNCRYCHAELTLSLVDLGSAPPSNAYLTTQTLRQPETWVPLRVLVCQQCWLVQVDYVASVQDMFSADYAYFSGFSKIWMDHCAAYTDAMVQRFGLGPDSHVVEVATNDGTLLACVQARHIPCTGVEPTACTAAAARAKGIEVVEAFFGVRLAESLLADGKAADLMTANNVLAHVPDLNDFVAGFAVLLKPQGVATFEFPHLLNLVQENQFDTIYHEHFSYLSLTVVQRIFADHHLAVFDVEEHPTHGGTLRVFAQPARTGRHARSARVEAMLAREMAAGVATVEYYAGFQARADAVKAGLLAFLLEMKRQGKKVAAYGAAAKGNTLLNYAGVRPDLLPYVVDRNPAKSGKYLPGSRIPIVAEGDLQADQPDFVLILPWNIKAEVMEQLAYVRGWGGRFVTAVPALQVC